MTNDSSLIVKHKKDFYLFLRMSLISASNNSSLVGSGGVGASTGAATSQLGSPSSIVSQSAGNGWWRISFSWTATATSNSVSIYLSNDGLWANRNSAITIGSGVFIYGAQLEAGSFATSYIPTVASQVTRTADVATITGANFSQWFNAAEGSFVVEASSFGIGSNIPTFLIASNGSAGEYVRLNGSSGYTIRLLVQAGSVQVANITAGSGLVSGVYTKAACAYAANSFQAAANGALGTEDTSGVLPSGVNQMLFGSFFGSAGTYLNGHIRSIKYFPTRLSNAQLQALTA